MAFFGWWYIKATTTSHFSPVFSLSLMFTLSHFRCESTSHWCYLLEFNDRAIFSRVSHCCSAIKSAVVFTHTPRWQLLLANIYRPSEHRIFQPKKFLCKHEMFSYYRLCCCMLTCQILHFEVFLIGFLDELGNFKQKIFLHFKMQKCFTFSSNMPIIYVWILFRRGELKAVY